MPSAPLTPPTPRRIVFLPHTKHHKGGTMPDTGEFKARSVELPDADMRLTVAYKGDQYDNLTDAEFIASLSGTAAE